MSAPAPRGWATAWSDLVGAAVLGTDRRPLPVLPDGLLPDALVAPGGRRSASGRADRAAAASNTGDTGDTGDDATRLLDRAAALTAVRRAGRLLDPVPAPLPPCPVDPRPPCPAAAARRLAEVREAWPVLVEEWLGALLDAGCRLPPEHAVGLLERFRADPARRALVAEAAGPLAPWLVARFPQRLAPRRPPAGAGGAATGVPVTGASAIELPAELADLLDRPPQELTEVVVDGLVSGRFVGRHRPTLVAFVCRLDPGALSAIAAGLEQQRDPRAALLAGDLAALARTRLALRADFAGTARDRSGPQDGSGDSGRDGDADADGAR